MKIKQYKKAFTLVELLLVTGIIAIASLVAYTVYSKVTLAYNVNKTVEVIKLIHASADDLVVNKNLPLDSGANGGWGNIAQVMCDSKGVAAQLCEPADALPVPTFKTSVGTLTLSGNFTGYKTVEMTLSNIKISECIGIAGKVHGLFSQVTAWSAGQGHSGGYTAVSPFIRPTLDDAIKSCHHYTADGETTTLVMLKSYNNSDGFAITPYPPPWAAPIVPPPPVDF